MSTFSKVTNLSEQQVNTISQILFWGLLFSSLLSRIKLFGINYGFHYLLIPLVCCIAIAINLKAYKNIIISYKYTLFLLLILYLWMWVSALTSEFQATAVSFFIKYSIYLFVFIAFLFILFDKQHKVFYYRLCFRFLIIIAVFGIIEYFSPKLWIFNLLRYPNPYPRLGSLVQGPNQFGVLMAIGAILALILSKERSISRLEFYPSILIFIVMVALSGSRNGWMVFIIGVFLAFVYKVTRLKGIILILTIWAFCMVSFQVPAYRMGLKYNYIFPLLSSSGEAKLLLDNPTSTALSRHFLWNAAISQTLKRPITGIGIGVFAEHIGLQVFGKKGFHAHDLFLNILVELGVPGLILFTAFISSLIQKTKMNIAIVGIPIIMLFCSQMVDFFIKDVTFTVIELYFLADASNYNHEVK